MKRQTNKIKISPTVLISIALMAIVVAGSLFYVIGIDSKSEKGTTLVSENKQATEGIKPIDFKTIEGRWVRPDGGYILAFSNTTPSGKVVAEYFNPSPIHVEEASILLLEGNIVLNVLLNDQNYPNCRYTLYYESTKDVLVGTYEQTMMGQTYQIYFERENKQ